jgi:rubrerythrin
MKTEEMLDNAIKMEEDGYNFYKQAENRTKDKLGKAMFSSLAEYEVHHKALLERLKKNILPVTADLDIPLPKEKLKSVFADMKERVSEHVPPSADDIDALSLGMEKETESFQMYRNAARDAENPAVKSMFLRMAQEEEEHYDILEKSRYYLEEFANWTLWIEGGPIEGG